MLKVKNNLKNNPLSKAQKQLLKVSLKKLLGNGLINTFENKRCEIKIMVLKDAFNLSELNNE